MCHFFVQNCIGSAQELLLLGFFIMLLCIFLTFLLPTGPYLCLRDNALFPFSSSVSTSLSFRRCSSCQHWALSSFSSHRSYHHQCSHSNRVHFSMQPLSICASYYTQGVFMMMHRPDPHSQDCQLIASSTTMCKIDGLVSVNITELNAKCTERFDVLLLHTM